MKKIFYLLILILAALSFACTDGKVAADSIAVPKTLQENVINKPESSEKLDLLDDKKIEKEIWSGESGKFKIRWTDKDIYIESEKGREKLFTNFARRYFEKNFKYENEYSEKLKKVVRTRKLNTCDIAIDGSIISLVGDYLTLEVEEYFFCGIVQYETHWIVFDLNNPNNILFFPESEDGYALGRGMKLTDFFFDRQVLQSFLDNSEVRESIAAIEKDFQPKTTIDLLSWFEKKQKQFHGAADNKVNYEFEDFAFENENYGLLSKRALSGFVFDRIEDNKIVVKVSLQTYFKMHGTPSIELKFDIPENLRNYLEAANLKQEGFLRKDTLADFSRLDFEGAKQKISDK